MNTWKKSKLGNHVDLLTGYPFRSQEYTDNESAIRLLRGDNVAQGYLRWRNAKKWPSHKAQGLEKYYLNIGDIVIAMDRTWVKAGLKIAQIRESDTPCLLVQRVARLRATNGIDPYFLYLLVRNHKFEQYVKGAQTETAVPHISASQIRQYPINLPPLTTQTAIADLLSAWDEAIEKTERLIQAKEKQFTWLLSVLLSGHARSGENNPWTEATLKDICTIGKGVQKNRDSLSATGAYPVVNGGITPSGYTDAWNANENTITISEGGNSCGYVSFMETPFWCGGHCYALKNLDIEEMDPKFLFYYLKRHENRIMRLRVGSGLPNIQRRDIEKFPVRYPRLEEQQRITLILSSAQQEIKLLQQMAEKYKDQKRGLTQKLLTGQWRILTDMENKQCV